MLARLCTRVNLNARLCESSYHFKTPEAFIVILSAAAFATPCASHVHVHVHARAVRDIAYVIRAHESFAYVQLRVTRLTHEEPIYSRDKACGLAHEDTRHPGRAMRHPSRKDSSSDMSCVRYSLTIRAVRPNNRDKPRLVYRRGSINYASSITFASCTHEASDA